MNKAKASYYMNLAQQFRFETNIQLVVLLIVLFLLQGCELFIKKNSANPAPVLNTDSPELCVTAQQNETFEDFCSLDRWLMYVIEIADMPWAERSSIINNMEDDTRSLLLKIILSQASDTPYSHRLRAQNWIIKISGKTSPMMKTILNDLVYENSQQLLEFESAVTLLSRVNSRQQKTISELQEQLEIKKLEIKVQQEQVNQLLKIETDLIEQNRSEKR